MTEQFEQGYEMTPEQEMLVQEAKKILGIATGEADEGKINDELRSIKKQLIARGENPINYILWHALIGSSISAGSKHFDTPEKDFETLVKKYML